MTAPRPLRLFLDANILISAAHKEGSRILQLWELPAVELIISQYVLAESERNIPDGARRIRLQKLLLQVEVLPSSQYAVSDPIDLAEKDRPVLADAVAARADYLVTGDKRHFGQWYGKRLLGSRIESPGNLLELLDTQISHPTDRGL